MSERRMKKFGPGVQVHLEAGEHLLEVVFAMAIKSPPRRIAQPTQGAIVGTGDTAARLVNEMPARTSGVVCITDRRVFFCGTGFSKVKKLWWEVPRAAVGGIVPGSPLFAIRFADDSQAWFGGGRPDYEAIANALGLKV